MTSVEFAAVTAAIAVDARTIADRILALKTEIDTLYNLAHGIAAVSASALPAASSTGIQGILAAHVEVGPAAEAEA